MQLVSSQVLVVLSLLPFAAGFFSAPVTGGAACRAWRPSAATASPGASHEAADLAGKERLKRFLEDAAFLGPIRFITMNEGAILESVGSFEGVSYKDLPKGEYATFASDDKTFEAHLNLDQVASVTMAASKAKHGEHMNYFTRFLDRDGKVLLTTMLHKPQGADSQYEDDAVEWWEKLKGIFGDSQQIIA